MHLLMPSKHEAWYAQWFSMQVEVELPGLSVNAGVTTQVNSADSADRQGPLSQAVLVPSSQVGFLDKLQYLSIAGLAIYSDA